jgi:hypothetical protein
MATIEKGTGIRCYTGGDFLKVAKYMQDVLKIPWRDGKAYVSSRDLITDWLDNSAKTFLIYSHEGKLSYGKVNELKGNPEWVWIDDWQKQFVNEIIDSSVFFKLYCNDEIN